MIQHQLQGAIKWHREKRKEYWRALSRRETKENRRDYERHNSVCVALEAQHKEVYGESY